MKHDMANQRAESDTCTNSFWLAAGIIQAITQGEFGLRGMKWQF